MERFLENYNKFLRVEKVKINVLAIKLGMKEESLKKLLSRDSIHITTKQKLAKAFGFDACAFENDMDWLTVAHKERLKGCCPNCCNPIKEIDILLSERFLDKSDTKAILIKEGYSICGACGEKINVTFTYDMTTKLIDQKLSNKNTEGHKYIDNIKYLIRVEDDEVGNTTREIRKKEEELQNILEQAADLRMSFNGNKELLKEILNNLYKNIYQKKNVINALKSELSQLKKNSSNLVNALNTLQGGCVPSVSAGEVISFKDRYNEKINFMVVKKDVFNYDIMLLENYYYEESFILAYNLLGLTEEKISDASILKFLREKYRLKLYEIHNLEKN